MAPERLGLHTEADVAPGCYLFKTNSFKKKKKAVHNEELLFNYSMGGMNMNCLYLIAD